MLQAQHSFQAATSSKDVWDFLWNIDALMKCIPGAQEVEDLGDGSYRASMRRKMGPFLLRFSLDIQVVKSEAPRFVELRITGKDRKLRSEIEQSLSIELADTPVGNCDVQMKTQIEINGVLASLGELLISGHIDHVLQEFSANVQSAIETGARAGSA